MKLITEVVEAIQVITEETSSGGKSYCIEGPFLQSDIKNKNGRVYPSHIMEKEVERYNNEYVKQNRAFGELGHPECNLSPEFDVLTANGWKPFLNLELGEKIATVNDCGNLEEHSIERIINSPYKGHAYHVYGRNIDSSFTPNHRFLLIDRNGKRKFVTIEEIYNNRTKYNHCIIPRTTVWTGNSPEHIIIPGINEEHIKNLSRYNSDISKPLLIDTKLFVQFLGIWLAEGGISKKKYNIFLYQNKGEKADKIQKMLDQFPISWNTTERTDKNKLIFRVSDRRLWEYLNNLGNIKTKHIPKDIKSLDAPYLEELIQWFILGDGRGWKRKGGPQDLFSISKQLVEDLHECLVKSGGCGNLKVRMPSKDYVYAGRLIEAKNKSPLYILNIASSTAIHLDKRFLKIDKIEHNGNVYCLTVKNSSFYMREKGKSFWTGNSPSINLERVSHMIKSLKKEGTNYIGRAKILDTPYGKIVKNLIDEGAKLGVSSRGVGTLTQLKDYNIVNNDFQLATAADIVADPSAPDAFVRGIFEGKEWIYENGIIKEKQIETYKQAIENASRRKKQEVIVEQFQDFLRKLK